MALATRETGVIAAGAGAGSDAAALTRDHIYVSAFLERRVGVKNFHLAKQLIPSIDDVQQLKQLAKAFDPSTSQSSIAIAAKIKSIIVLLQPRILSEKIDRELITNLCELLSKIKLPLSYERSDDPVAVVEKYPSSTITLFENQANLKFTIFVFLISTLEVHREHREFLTPVFEAFKNYITELFNTDYSTGKTDAAFSEEIAYLMVSLANLSPALCKRMLNELVFPILNGLSDKNFCFADYMLNFFRKMIQVAPQVWTGLSSSEQREVIFAIEEWYSVFSKKITPAFFSILDALILNSNCDSLLIALEKCSISNGSTLVKYVEAFRKHYQSSSNKEALPSNPESAIKLFMKLAASTHENLLLGEVSLKAIIALVENNPCYYKMINESLPISLVSLANTVKSFALLLESIYPFSAAAPINSLKALKDLDKDGRVLSKKEALLVNCCMEFLDIDRLLIKDRIDILLHLGNHIFSKGLASQEQVSRILEILPQLFGDPSFQRLLLEGRETILKFAKDLVANKNASQGIIFDIMAPALIKLINDQLSRELFSTDRYTNLVKSVLDFLEICASNNFRIIEAISEKSILPALTSKIPVSHPLLGDIQRFTETLSANHASLLVQLKALLIPDISTVASLMDIIINEDFLEGTELEAFRNFCAHKGFEKKRQAYKDLRQNQAIKRLAELAAHADEAIHQELLQKVTLLSAALLECCFEIDYSPTNDQVENVTLLLKTFNTLIEHHPEVCALLSDEDIDSDFLLNLSEKTDCPDMAAEAMKLLSYKMVYFTQALKQEVNLSNANRIARIYTLINICKYDLDECAFFAGLVPDFIACALNTKEAIEVRLGALNAFAVLVEKGFQDKNMLKRWQEELRACALDDEHDLKQLAVKLLSQFDREFINVAIVNAGMRAFLDAYQTGKDYANEIPGLIAILCNEMIAPSLRVYALDTLILFANYSPHYTRIQSLIPLLRSNDNFSNGLLGDTAKNLLNVLMMYGRPFLESMGDLYESLPKIEVLPAKVKEPIGVVGSIERRVYDLLGSLSEATALQEGIEIIEQFTIMICTENGARETLQMQDINGALNSFVQRFENTLTVEVSTAIVMLRGLTEHISSVFYKGEQINEPKAATLFSDRVVTTALVANELSRE